MDRLKDFAVWIIVIIAFWLFVNGIIYMHLHPDIVGGTIYNLTHWKQTENVAK